LPVGRIIAQAGIQGKRGENHMSGNRFPALLSGQTSAGGRGRRDSRPTGMRLPDRPTSTRQPDQIRLRAEASKLENDLDQ
jgi:hypothetical protein